MLGVGQRHHPVVGTGVHQVIRGAGGAEPGVGVGGGDLVQPGHGASELRSILGGGSPRRPTGLFEQGEGQPCRQDAVGDLGGQVPLVQVHRQHRGRRVRMGPRRERTVPVEPAPGVQCLATHHQGHLGGSLEHPLGRHVEQSLGRGSCQDRLVGRRVRNAEPLGEPARRVVVRPRLAVHDTQVVDRPQDIGVRPGVGSGGPGHQLHHLDGLGHVLAGVPGVPSSADDAGQAFVEDVAVHGSRRASTTRAVVDTMATICSTRNRSSTSAALRGRSVSTIGPRPAATRDGTG